MNVAGDLARLVRLRQQKKLVARVELEAPWREVVRAIDALLTHMISGKAVLHVERPSGKVARLVGR